MKSCTCYDEVREKLEDQGLTISDKCKTMRLTDLTLSGHIGFPLQTIDGKKRKSGQPGFLFLSFCPFCGQKYEEKK